MSTWDSIQAIVIGVIVLAGIYFIKKYNKFQNLTSNRVITIAIIFTGIVLCISGIAEIIVKQLRPS